LGCVPTMIATTRTNVATAVATRGWDVTSAAHTPALGPMLRIGARAVPVRDVCGVVGSAEHETDRNPAFVTLAVFGLIACVFLVGVADIGWRTRFLVGAVVFGAIGLAALNDMAWLTRRGIYRVEVLLHSGETLRYATIDVEDQQRLLTAVGRHLVRPTAANDEAEPARTRPAPALA
jgi:hypothetical protein